MNLLWLFLITFLLRLPTLYTSIVDLDESVFAICGEVVRQGGRLYIDCIDHQPPLVYWFFAGVFKMFGPYNMVAVHLLTSLVVCLTALSLAKIAERLYGQSVGLWAALLYILFSTTHIPKIISTNIEVLANLPLVAAWCLLFAPLARFLAESRTCPTQPNENSECRREQGIKGSTRPEATDNNLARSSADSKRNLVRGASFLGGLLMAVAFLLKYQVALILVFWILALLRRPKDFLWASLGAATFLGIVLGTFYLHGNLIPFYTETLTRGWEYARQGNVTSEFGKMVVIRLGMTILCAAPLWYFFTEALVNNIPLPRWEGVRGRVTMMVWLVGALVAALLGGRLYPHYFLLMLPPLCLIAAPAVAKFWSQISRSKKVLWGCLFAVWALVFFLPRLNFQKSYQWFYQNYPQLDTGVEPMLHETTYRAVGKFIRERSTFNDRIVVWGFSTPIYFFSGRLPGTSSVWSDDLTGRVSGPPQSLDTSAFIRPGAWEKFMGEMERNRPLWLVDTSPADLTYYGKYPIRHYSSLAALIDAHYERIATIDHVDLYRRR